MIQDEQETRPEPAPEQAAPAPAAAEGAPRAGAFVRADTERGGGGRGGGERGGGERGGGGRGRYFGRRRVCAFCMEKVHSIDYKDPVKLRRYLSDRGRIDARRKTGTCAKHQRWLAVALKRARHLALLPYAPEHIRASGMFAGRR